MTPGRLSGSLGIARSLAIYWRPGRQKGLQRLYRPFVSAGDLVFDLGAHLGDRTRAFAALGARVVAVEPQPRILPWLHRLVGGRPGVTIVEMAVGSEAGWAELAISRSRPTVSTLADGWRDRLRRVNPGFQSVRWDDSVRVPVTTLDRLIREYGVPTFCKIDVEGFESEVLAGLSRPLPALSLEFVAGGLDVAGSCVERLADLGVYEFNAVPGEERNFHFAGWCSCEETREWLVRGADDIPSGDLYARRLLPPDPSWTTGTGSRSGIPPESME